MRVSLTLKPDSRSDFGVHAHWYSTGARVQFIQPGETFHFFIFFFFLFEDGTFYCQGFHCGRFLIFSAAFFLM